MLNELFIENWVAFKRFVFNKPLNLFILQSDLKKYFSDKLIFMSVLIYFAEKES